MNLLLLNYEFPPLGGGASTATHNIALQLVRRGHAVHVLTSRYGHQPEEEVIDGIRVYRVASWRRGIHDCGLVGAASYLFFAFFKLRRLLRENKYDVFHYFFSLPTGLLSLYSNGLCRFPYILSLRGSDVPGYDPTAPWLQILHGLLKPITRLIWKRAGTVVALSEGLREFAHRTAPGVPIMVIPNGIDVEAFRPAGNGHSGPARLLKIITVARLIERKGLDLLLEAVSRFSNPEIHLSIVGTGQEESNLKNLASQLKLTGMVEFHGYRSQPDLEKLYNEADLFVLPSMAESFGMVILEAMACGLPVVATNVGGIPEIIGQNENGILVDPGRVESLVEGIRILVSDPGMRARLSANNVAKVKDRFTWNKVAVQYEYLFKAQVDGEIEAAGEGIP